jgi:hypothetical protein
MAETVALRALYQYFAKMYDLKADIFGNGDDALIRTEKPFDPNKLFDTIRTMGMVPNEDKTTVSSDEFNYLQMTFRGEGGVMATTRMLTRILFAERGVDVNKAGMSVKNFWTLNTLSKLENCKRHPNFKEFVEFVQTGDQFGLDVSELLDVTVTDRGFTGGSDTVEGIGGWESVKILNRTTGKAEDGSIQPEWE